MGCGESKHAVATENTLIKSKSKNPEINSMSDAIVKADDFQQNVQVEKNETSEEIKPEKEAENVDEKEALKNVRVEKNETSEEIKPEKEAENVEEKEALKKPEEKDGGEEKGAVDDHKNEESDPLVEGKLEEKKDEIKNEELETETKDDATKEMAVESIVSKAGSGESGNDSPNVPEEKIEENDDTNKQEEEAVEVDEGKEVVVPTEEAKSSEVEKTIDEQKKENDDAETPPADEKAN